MYIIWRNPSRSARNNNNTMRYDAGTDSSHTTTSCSEDPRVGRRLAGPLQRPTRPSVVTFILKAIAFFRRLARTYGKNGDRCFTTTNHCKIRRTDS